ncbi:50S ribosomal protein L22 [Granulicella mallensis]|jgi:large subunit ribosomal protein L22|uniref:Large ribosomal subunit protein uL22 n=1 Tax=Granulicella mallensis TaxID=940614 RepID=A0A7W8EB36_9BACT|nr:50S ribosomal protein L22 [Granulicella mallensis]MBB5065164.1 large subunit ribosomal protein L22 [Granulicella mallensis]
MAKVTAPKAPEFRAEAKFQRGSPQKAKLVLDLIKGQRVEAAINTVAFTNKRWSPIVEKVLRSAVQNAVYLSGEQGLDVDVDNLYVKTAIANEGPRMKRIRPAPMGRAFRYQRRISHIIITVAEKKSAATANVEAPATPAKKTAGKPAAKKAATKAPAKKAAAKKAPAKKAAAK